MFEVGLFLVSSCEVLQMNSHTRRNVSWLTMNSPRPCLLLLAEYKYPRLGWADPQRRVMSETVLVLVRETISWSSASTSDHTVLLLSLLQVSDSKYGNKQGRIIFLPRCQIPQLSVLLAIIIISHSCWAETGHSPENNDDSPTARNVSELTSSFPSATNSCEGPVSRTLR